MPDAFTPLPHARHAKPRKRGLRRRRLCARLAQPALRRAGVRTLPGCGNGASDPHALQSLVALMPRRSAAAPATDLPASAHGCLA